MRDQAVREFSQARLSYPYMINGTLDQLRHARPHSTRESGISPPDLSTAVAKTQYTSVNVQTNSRKKTWRACARQL